MTDGGITGDYRGSCVVCLQGTDTGLSLVGEAEWVVAGLQVLGVPPEQAPGVLASATDLPPGRVPDGEVTVTVAVCKSCADKSSAPFEVGLMATGVPAYRPKPGSVS